LSLSGRSSRISRCQYCDLAALCTLTDDVTSLYVELVVCPCSKASHNSRTCCYCCDYCKLCSSCEADFVVDNRASTVVSAVSPADSNLVRCRLRLNICKRDWSVWYLSSQYCDLAALCTLTDDVASLYVELVGGSCSEASYNCRPCGHS